MGRGERSSPLTARPRIIKQLLAEGALSIEFKIVIMSAALRL